MYRSSTANSRTAKHTDDRKKNAEAAVDEPNPACLSFYPSTSLLLQRGSKNKMDAQVDSV